MFKKKQILAMVGIAIISFVIGSMFNVMASDSGNPWDKVWTTVSELESRVETLEGQLPQQGFLTAPAYDSGWFTAYTGEWITIEHNLNSINLLVYVIRNDSILYEPSRISYGINQVGWDNRETGWLHLTENSIVVGISWLNEYDSVRVQIWKISEPPS